MIPNYMIEECRRQLNGSYFDNRFEGALDEALAALSTAENYFYIGKVHNPFLKKGKRGRTIANLISNAIPVIRSYYRQEDLNPFQTSQVLSVPKGDSREGAEIIELDYEKERCRVQPLRDRAESYYLPCCLLIRFNPEYLPSVFQNEETAIEPKEVNESEKEDEIDQTTIFEFI